MILRWCLIAVSLVLQYWIHLMNFEPSNKITEEQICGNPVNIYFHHQTLSSESTPNQQCTFREAHPHFLNRTEEVNKGKEEHHERKQNDCA